MEKDNKRFYHAVVQTERRYLLINQAGLEQITCNIVRPYVEGRPISIQGSILQPMIVKNVRIYQTKFQLTRDDLNDRTDAQDTDSVCAVKDSDEITEKVFAYARQEGKAAAGEQREVTIIPPSGSEGVGRKTTAEVTQAADTTPKKCMQDLVRTLRILGVLVLAISVLGIFENVSVKTVKSSILATCYLIIGIPSIGIVFYGFWKLTGLFVVLSVLGSLASIAALWLWVLTP